MLVTTPQSRLTPCQLPGRGAFLGGLPLTKSCPRVRGKWHGEAMTKGERLKAAQLFYCSPQSAYAASSPINGGAFGVQYKHGVQCRNPSRSDRFNGVTGVARGPKGRNRNFPRPPGKKDYKVAYSSLFNSLSLAYGSTAPSTGRLLGAFYQLFLVIPHCRADMQANYCLHLIFMIYLKAKSPQGVRHAKAAYC